MNFHRFYDLLCRLLALSPQRRQPATVLDEIARLKATAPYARHDPECAAVAGARVHWERQCSCGLHAARASGTPRVGSPSSEPAG